MKLEMKTSEKIMFAAFFGLVAVGTVFAQSMGKTTRAVESDSAQSSPVMAMSAHTEHSAHQASITEVPSSLAHRDSHGGHSQEKPANASVSTQVKLTTSGTILPNKAALLVIDIQDTKGKAIAKFDTFQEKLMHLIVASDNLQVFQHLHPNYKGNGRFEVETALPQPGNYTLISDYKPAGQKETVSVLKVKVPGTQTSAPAIALDRSKTIDATKVNLELSKPILKAGEEVMLTFDLKDATSSQPVQDLKPYLGEQGHLVILKQSSPLTKADYIHAHAMQGTLTGKVEFMTTFPKPGKYKLWGQFNRNGKIVIADFWINVN